MPSGGGIHAINKIWRMRKDGEQAMAKPNKKVALAKKVVADWHKQMRKLEPTNNSRNF